MSGSTSSARCACPRGGAFALGSLQLFLGRALPLRRSLLQRASFLSSLDCLRSLPVGAPLRRASGENHRHDQQDKHAGNDQYDDPRSMLFLPRSFPPGVLPGPSARETQRRRTCRVS